MLWQIRRVVKPALIFVDREEPYFGRSKHLTRDDWAVCTIDQENRRGRRTECETTAFWLRRSATAGRFTGAAAGAPGSAPRPLRAAWLGGPRGVWGTSGVDCD